jgi:AraC-like DNA-binding protein/Tfp pilus assembly protein PilF
MKHFYLACLIVALLWLTDAFALPTQSQHQPQSSGYPDIDIYYSQLERNIAKKTMACLYRRFEATPMDTVLAAYPVKGLTDGEGLTDGGRTISTIDYFTFFPSKMLTDPERSALVEELYAKVRSSYKGKQMELLAGFVKGFQMSNDSLSYESKMEWYEQVIRQARKAGESHIEALALQDMWFSSFFSQRYVRTFTYGQRLEEALGRIDDGYRHKSSDYFDIGMAYYLFKDYTRALPLLHKALSYRGTKTAHNPNVILKAWNYLAIYHQMNNNPDSAACYNRMILSSEEARYSEPAHLPIAICNLGRIEMENGNYDSATAMLEAGLKYTDTDLDDSFRAGIRISLGLCYLEKGDKKAVREQIAAARSAIEKVIEIDRQKRLKDLYALESNYYVRSGQYDTARICQDSALMASALYEQLTGQHFILLGEQQLREAELQLKSHQIAQQRNVIFIVLIILAVICGALFAILRLYRKKQAAYRNLVDKNRQWAENELLEKTTADTSLKRLISRKEEELIGRIHKMMAGEQIYHNPALTLDALARMLNVNRESISRTINLTTGKNFTRFLNEYRIKEAVRVLSNARNRIINFDELAEQVGFNNRTTFHRAFKQITGLPPNEFKTTANNKSENIYD